MSKSFNRYFKEEDILRVIKYIIRCFFSLVITEMYVKIMLRYFSFMILVKLKKFNINKRR